MKTEVDFDLDSIASTPAPRPFQPSGNTLAKDKKILLKTMRNYMVLQLGDSFNILKSRNREMFFEISRSPVLVLESFEGIDESEENRRFIMSPELEDWAAQTLASKESVPPEEKNSIRHLRQFAEFSKLFSEKTKTALFSGYLPRHHLGLAVLLERLPALHAWVAPFPLILTHLAERFLYDSVDQETFFPNLELALSKGWRGLFDFCGLSKDLNSILYVKNIILGGQHGLLERHDKTRTAGHCLNPVTEEVLESLPIRMPLHDEILQHLVKILPFSKAHPKWVNWQINQRHRILDGRDDPVFLGILSGELSPSLHTGEDKDEILRNAFLPLLHLHGTTWKKGHYSLTPEEFAAAPHPDSLEKEQVFQEFLTDEEQIQFGNLIREGTVEEVLQLLKEDVEYSSGVLRFFQLWNDERIDHALMKQPLLPPYLMRLFLYLYPKSASECPALLFHKLAGQALRMDFMATSILGSISDEPHLDKSYQKLNHIWNFRQIRKIIQDFGHTRLGRCIARSQILIFPCALAAFLRRTPPDTTWEALLKHPLWEVRGFLTMNPYTPTWVRTRLAQDPSVNVRILLAEQPWFMIHDVVEDLLRDTHPEVIHALAWNRSLPFHVRRNIPIDSPYTAALISLNRHR